MPSTDNRNFANGSAQVQAYGQKDALSFENVWAAGDTWSAPIASTAGNATLGVGNLNGTNPTALFVYRSRVYMANISRFNFSDNDDPTGWEVQNSGAGEIGYVTSFGSEDTVKTFSQLQGRLAVFGRRSVQLWTTDADPNNFAWIQTLDNSGTQAPLSAVNLGDYDVLYLDDAGVRSLRAKEVTSNAYIDDVGSPIDDLIQALTTANYTKSSACAVVETLQKNYWLAVPRANAFGGVIYVLSKHPAVKQNAWSIYNCTYVAGVVTPSSGTYDINGQVTYAATIGNTYSWKKGAHDQTFTDGVTTLLTSGTLVAASTTLTGFGFNSQSVTSTVADITPIGFIPLKFFVYQGLVYVLAQTSGNILRIFQYGSTDGQTCDGTQCIAQLPFLDDKMPDLNKKFQGIQFIQAGRWTISMCVDPDTNTFTDVVTQGDAASPNSLLDSSYDQGRIGVELFGTHFAGKLTSNCVYGASGPAVFSSLSVGYNRANTSS